MAAARDEPPLRETVAEFAPLGIVAYTTTRAAGNFSLATPAAEDVNAARWVTLASGLSAAGAGLVSAIQVHGVEVAEHDEAWPGWRRLAGVDGHVVRAAGAAAITVADCVPVFVAHPGGVVAIVHAGWRGTVSRVLPEAVARLTARGLDAADLHVHLGPAICGRCYEVGPDVFEQLTGWQTSRRRNVDLRALLAEQARAAGIGKVSASASCTRCDNDRFFSHRCGDGGRQIAVIASGTTALP